MNYWPQHERMPCWGTGGYVVTVFDCTFHDIFDALQLMEWKSQWTGERLNADCAPCDAANDDYDRET